MSSILNKAVLIKDGGGDESTTEGVRDSGGVAAATDGVSGIRSVNKRSGESNVVGTS